MKTKILITRAALLVLFSTLNAQLSTQAQGTAFTYQGRLNHGGGPANGLYELSFALYDAVTNGNIVGAPATIAPVLVSNGLFTATLDFGANTFTGANRWLEISVTVFGSDQPVVTLVPRQPITPVPYALHAAGLTALNDAPLDINVNGQRIMRLNSGDLGAPKIVGGSESNFVASGAYGATIAGGGSTTLNWPNIVRARFATISGGALNTIEEEASFGVIAGGSRNSINRESASTTISGGQGNIIGEFSIGSTIGGGSGNQIHFNNYHPTIAGGYANVVENNNNYATVGGGWQNIIHNNSSFSTISGGWGNSIGVGARISAIGGGAFNRIHAADSVIGGGDCNTILAGAEYSVIPGGLFNTVEGKHACALGRRAKARHDGAFVWGDASNQDIGSEMANEFVVRATGGVRFATAIDSTGSNVAGVTLAPGSGSWSSLSDRHAKENFAVANAREILDKVAALPMASWNYKAQGAGVRHLGPMAQDFRAAFGLGLEDTSICTVDADGVALAAIQGLNQKLSEQEARLKNKDSEIQELRQAVAELQKIVSQITHKTQE